MFNIYLPLWILEIPKSTKAPKPPHSGGGGPKSGGGGPKSGGGGPNSGGGGDGSGSGDYVVGGTVFHTLVIILLC